MNQMIEDFFNRYVFGWMYSDVGICEKHGANFGGAALICAYIDFMGKLYLGIVEDGYAEKRFLAFIDNFFDDKYKQFSKFIYSDYRCGLLHQFFPKRGAGITRGEETREYHLILDKENGLIPINLTVFLEDFKKAVDTYYGKLLEDNQLQDNFIKVHESIKSSTSQNLENLLSERLGIIKEPATLYSASTSSFISGAPVSSFSTGVSPHNLDAYISRMPTSPKKGSDENKTPNETPL